MPEPTISPDDVKVILESVAANPPESVPVEPGRSDGAPPGAPAPPNGVDAEGKPVGFHWSKELKRWAKNRGKYKGGSAGNSTSTPPVPHSSAGAGGPTTAPGVRADAPAGTPPPNPSLGSVAPESSAEREERRKRKRADMAVQADTYEPLAKSGLQFGNEAFFKPGGIDLFKLPAVGFRTTKDGDVVALDPEKGANIGDNTARAIAEIAGGLAPGLMSWPYSAPLLSLTINAVSLVILASAISKQTAQREREARDAKRAVADAPHSEDIKVTDASTGEEVAA